ncbi:MAG TPA: HU family DNA-binding protein [Dongiaceae bacterium]|nr:HU family DNA-binding protein [Dongiaceae bacterium]
MSAKATAKASSAATVTLKHLASKLAEDQGLAKKQTEALLGDLVGLVTRHLKKGDRIRISGLGILQVRKRAARMGRNPATGEAIKIKASKKVAFRAAKELKEAV